MSCESACVDLRFDFLCVKTQTLFVFLGLGHDFFKLVALVDKDVVAVGKDSSAAAMSAVLFSISRAYWLMRFSESWISRV